MVVAKTKRIFTEQEQKDLYEIGDHLRLAREGKGLTQLALALEVGCDRATISHYEAGTGGYMKTDIMYRICDILEVSPDELSPKRYGVKNDKTEFSLDEMLRSLPKDKRDLLLPGLNAMIAAYM